LRYREQSSYGAITVTVFGVKLLTIDAGTSITVPIPVKSIYVSDGEVGTGDGLDSATEPGT